MTQVDCHSSRPEGYSPWGKYPLPERNPNEAACLSELGGSPALLRVLSAPARGLVATFDAHEGSKEKFPNERKPGAQAGNLAARERNAC